MSVTTYDSSFSFRQGQVARLGETAAASRGPMSAEDRRKFDQSPFMMKMKEIDQMSWQKFSARDKKRKERDPNFKPQDVDFEAPKAFKFDKQVDYYKVLGIDEYSTNDEVKKAYRKLSLTYHPDKTAGKSQDEKDEYAAIFMEIKDASKTLSDDPTRRQYDFERDRDVVSANHHGRQPKEKDSFNASEAMKRILEKAKENQKAPAEVVRIPVQIRLEKFVFGGHKAIRRPRQVKSKYGGFEEEVRVFRVDVPPGAEQPFVCEFKRQGDQHEDRETDTVKFLFTAKPHHAVERCGQDLRVRNTIDLGNGLRYVPFLTAQAPSVNGRHVILWGRNPFFHAEGGEEGELNLRLVGEGVSKTAALCFRLRLGLQAGSGRHTSGGSSGRGAGPGSGAVGARDFLCKFGLGPPWDFAADRSAGAASSASAAESIAARRRAQQERRRRVCDLELARVGSPLTLFTKNQCSVQYFASGSASNPMFAACLSSPPCAKQRAGDDWEALKSNLARVLQRTVFLLLREARAILPRPLAESSWSPHRSFLRRTKAPCMPWKRLGDEAFKRGDYWEAMSFYSHRIREFRLDCDDDETDASPAEAPPLGPDQVPESAKVLSNRAACLAKVCDFRDSLLDAQRAAELAPRWAKPWSRIGAALGVLSDSSPADISDALTKAVELDPTLDHVASLFAAVQRQEAPNTEAAHQAKEAGNQAVLSGQLGLAVATYTTALAHLPAPVDAEDAQQKPDPNALLRAILLSNRAAAFIRLRNFNAAISDGREAVAAQPGLAAPRCHLGAALLGCNMHQEAYMEFAKALQMEQDHRRARKGSNACLKEMVLWRSASAAARFQARFYIDLRRPRGTTRIFALSDIHFDHRENEDWVHAIDDTAFQDDVLIVAGNVADSKVAVGRCLTTLKQKFRRVFYTVGNHEMSITPAERGRYPDSIAKLHAIFQECDDLGVDIFPAPVCEGVSVVPLFSWYSSDFDEQDPFPDPNVERDKHCKWPMDPDLQLWKYMAKSNEAFLAKPYLGTVLTFSHFLPRRNLPFDKNRKSAAKFVGCDLIEEQLRLIKSRLHVYGHSRVKCAQIHSGVRYANCPLGFENEWPKDVERKLMMVFNGRSLCTHEWGANGEPPLGFEKRLVYAAMYQMPQLKELVFRKLQAAAAKLNNTLGVQVSFNRLGSQKKDKAAFVKEAWPELEALSLDSTHGLVIVADDLDALKGLCSSDLFRNEFVVVAQSAGRLCASFSAPLGVDLRHEKRTDATLVLLCLRQQVTVTEDSGQYMKLDGAVDAIGKLPGIEGKIAVGLQPTGFGKSSQRELSSELGLPDDGKGFTHCFFCAVDSPASFQSLAVSKTYGKWKTAYESSLVKHRTTPAVMGFALPIEITASAAAPKKDKKPKVAAPLGSTNGRHAR